MKTLFLSIGLVGAFALSAQVTITHIAGNGTQGYVDGSASAARFYNPFGLAWGNDGNLYIADSRNYCIRKYNPTTNTFSTLAGNGSPGYADGTGSAARFNYPFDIEVEPVTGDLIVSDVLNNRVRRVTMAGVVTTICGSDGNGLQDGTGNNVKFWGPYGMDWLPNGNIVIVDRYNHAVREMTLTGTVTTLAGNGSPGYVNGVGAAARFNAPICPAVLPNGDILVTDRDNQCIRKIVNGFASTFAGSGFSGLTDGPLAAAQFNDPNMIIVDELGNVLLSDFSNHAIRLIANNYVYTLAGNGTPGLSSDPTQNCLYEPVDMCSVPGSPDQVYVSQRGAQGIEKFTISNLSGQSYEISALQIGQNFPNPVVDETTFPVFLTEPTPVTVTIYSMLGELIWENDFGLLEAGENRVTIQASKLGLATGAYVYAVQAGRGSQATQVSKVMLVK